MRILIATPWLAPLGGGLERYAAQVAHELAHHAHDVTLLGHVSAREPVDERVDGVRRVGVVPRLVLSNTPLSFAIHQKARAILRELPHDVVNVHTPVPGTAELVALAARRARVPHVVTYHAGTLGAPTGLLRLAARLHRASAQRWLFRTASARIAVSPFVGDRIYGWRSHEVIPPGVDTDHFRPVADPVPGRVLFVGPVDRAYRWKGFGVLADAFDALAARHPEAHLRVVGAGDEVGAYRARFEGRPVAFVGRVDDATLVREYSRASVVVLPSITDAESFGMCLAEANACARPVVASAIGGIPSFVDDGENGLLVPPGDPVALSEMLHRILEDPTFARRMGLAGRAKVEKHHRWDEVARRTLDVYTRAIERRFTGASERATRRSAT